ncbi:MAG: hypothetical protein ACRYFS_25800 [Janthinobacterium lividum]
MPEEEPRLDLAGNPLPPLTSSAPVPTPSYAPPLRPVGPAPMPAFNSGAAYAPHSSVSETGGGSMKLKIGLSIGGLLLVLLITAIVALTPKHTPAPTAFTAFSAADNSFSCAAPTGWNTTPAASGAKMSDGSESTVGGVLFQQNSASIDITTDSYATLVAYDVMNNNADPQSLTGSKAGVLHKQWHKRIAAEHKGYTETQIADFEGAMGDGRLAEWTGAGNALGFGGSLHGYRASLADGGKTAVIVCSCLESDWPALKPAFQHVLLSFIAGEAEAPAPAMPGSP